MWKNIVEPDRPHMKIWPLPCQWRPKNRHAIPDSSNIFFSYARRPDCLWGPPNLLFSVKYASFLRSVFVETWHLLLTLSSFEANNACSYTFIHPYKFIPSTGTILSVLLIKKTVWHAHCLNQAAECMREVILIVRAVCVCVFVCWGRGGGVGSVADILYILCQMEFEGRAIMLFPWSVTCLQTPTPFTQQVDSNNRPTTMDLSYMERESEY